MYVSLHDFRCLFKQCIETKKTAMLGEDMAVENDAIMFLCNAFQYGRIIAELKK